MTLTNALYDLAIHPEYVKLMREEIEAIISEDGWTKFAMQRMRKVDTFLKESQRLNTLEHVGMFRKVMKDYTLSGGTVLPAGTDICFASRYINRDERSFPDGQTFRGFRFTEMNDGDVKYQMVSLSMDFIAFGHGRSACPGRFFAVNEIKAIFAHILLEYDIQLENGSMERPASLKHKTANKPNARAKIMFRKRVVD
ncbi:hypothetical protein Agabi119p4_3930 [Agaricus bisporus var. burnettii]|uniref:Cytochrome P450 n=1 Tax=Agaricus bisporus var. burnettii TaxID=192524 RepID=A0A8H7F5M5_AGABI|nr:hypothetical protein Agabi119p4_3930 [Agaricus bisporus var. burnettii]